MTSPDPQLAVEVRGLREGLDEITGSVGEIVGRQHQTIDKVQRAVKWLRIFVALLVAVSGVVVWNALRLTDIQSRTSDRVLCPLYEVFLRSYHPEAQKPEKLVEYERNFKVVRDGAAELGCTAVATSPTLKPSARSSQ